ncbi:hypothetical protein SLEP1_g39172 [Rubroshorea leprosula]|uniref:Uncharacterized protein n=1 Tax=Rubroshorea leprosula TaxID=152421 RepID=A0AAV5KZE3_9ROSI|nr:hypothetical protein SLEP1_g39172 [Rubroshorea leprosula]
MLNLLPCKHDMAIFCHPSSKRGVSSTTVKSGRQSQTAVKLGPLHVAPDASKSVLVPLALLSYPPPFPLRNFSSTLCHGVLLLGFSREDEKESSCTAVNKRGGAAEGMQGGVWVK